MKALVQKIDTALKSTTGLILTAVFSAILMILTLVLVFNKAISQFIFLLFVVSMSFFVRSTCMLYLKKKHNYKL